MINFLIRGEAILRGSKGDDDRKLGSSQRYVLDGLLFDTTALHTAPAPREKSVLSYPRNQHVVEETGSREAQLSVACAIRDITR